MKKINANSIIGNEVAKTYNTIYQAGSDGFVVAQCDIGGDAFGNELGMQLKTGMTNPPANIVKKETRKDSTHVQTFAFYKRIKKDDFYKLEIIGEYMSEVRNISVKFIPYC